MKTEKQSGRPILSAAAVWWYYIAVVLTTPIYLFMTGFTVYCMIFETGRVFSTDLLVLLGSLNGLAAVGLTLRRKMAGPLWSLLFPVFVGLAALGLGGRSGITSHDLAPLALLTAAPTLMLLSQLPTLKKASVPGPGWGIGPLPFSGGPGQPASRVPVWWLRITCALSLLFYLGITVGVTGRLISDPPRSSYSAYMAIIAGISGLYAVLLTYRKNMAGPVWSLAVCFFLLLGTVDIGFGRPLRQFTSAMLPFAVVMTLMLFSQLPYLKNLLATGGGLPARSGSGEAVDVRGGVFQKEHFANGEALTEEDLAGLQRVWSAHSMSFGVFYIPGMALALIGSHLLSRNIGGFVGNIMAVALLFGMLFVVMIISLKRKRRYLACLERLGLTADEVKEALRLKKQGTVATRGGN